MKNNGQRASERENRSGKGLRREWAVGLICLLLATALPALAAVLFGLEGRSDGELLSGETPVAVGCHGGGEAEEMPLERVLILSLAATNPSDTPAASLEAQAVVLRSRAVWWLGYCDGSREETEQPGAEGGGGRKTLCDSPSHGLPYRSESRLIALLGADETAARIEVATQAVTSTRGQVLCFEGEVIPAMAHTSFGGVTRAVEELPWLAAVSTPEEPIVTVCRIPAEDARAALAARFGLLLSADPREWAISVAPAEGVTESVSVGGETLSATLFADALALPSGNFAVETAEDALMITCTGEGSGCGLSRAGAAVYARGGLSWGEILAHYYPDCTLGRSWE